MLAAIFDTLTSFLFPDVKSRGWARDKVGEETNQPAAVVRYRWPPDEKFASGAIIATPLGIELWTSSRSSTAYDWAKVAEVRQVRNSEGYLDRIELNISAEGQLSLIPQSPYGAGYTHSEVKQLVAAMEGERPIVQA